MKMLAQVLMVYYDDNYLLQNNHFLSNIRIVSAEIAQLVERFPEEE